MKVIIEDSTKGYLRLEIHTEEVAFGSKWKSVNCMNKIYLVDGYFIYVNANDKPLKVFKDKIEIIEYFQEKGEVIFK